MPNGVRAGPHFGVLPDAPTDAPGNGPPGGPLPITAPQHRGAPPLVSVCCITYNHERFIGAALEGILMQRTRFPVEILIHDDASTDRTAQIIRAYEECHPWLFRPIYQSENQYSRKVKVTHLNYARARGRYVALCDGDDAWTDPHKLERQIAQMERHPGCRLSFHPAREIDYSRGEAERVIGRYGKQGRLVATEEVIVKRFGMIPTSSCVATLEAVQEFLKFAKARPYLTVGDIYMQIIASLGGGALYLPEPMSVYRTRTAGSWTGRASTDPAFRLNHIRARVRSLRELDAETGFRFALAFRRANRKSVLGVLRWPNLRREEKAVFYAEHKSALGMADRFAYLLRSRLSGAGR